MSMNGGTGEAYRPLDNENFHWTLSILLIAETIDFWKEAVSILLFLPTKTSALKLWPAASVFIHAVVIIGQ